MKSIEYYKHKTTKRTLTLWRQVAKFLTLVVQIAEMRAYRSFNQLRPGWSLWTTKHTFFSAKELQKSLQ